MSDHTSKTHRPPRRRRGSVPLGLCALAALLGAAGGEVLLGGSEAPAILSGSTEVSPAVISGQPRLIDGDTFDIAGQRVRLWGMDAPERAQTCTDGGGASYRCGQAATDALRTFLAGRPVACDPVDTDRYERTVARCAVAGEDLGGWLVRHGYALDYTHFSHGRYLAAEMRARAERAGVWAGDFERPEDWRRQRR